MTADVDDRDAIIGVDRLDFRVEPFDWRFATEQAERIDAHWTRAVSARPSLFDGRVLLAHSIDRAPDSSGTLHGKFFITGFKTFIAWRDFGHPGEGVVNCFAMPALRAVDGAFVLGVMSATTSNAGRLYFPAGTPDETDVGADGAIDFLGNALRELEEETGLRRTEVELGRTWTIVYRGPRVACMKAVHSLESVASLRRRLLAHNASHSDPELSDLLPVRGPGDYDPMRMPDFMLFYLDHALAAGAQDQAR